ncbi:kynureninase [Sphingomonas mesophila]|uniref:kynureninase n=1 Tax=Sphingomonas mesophila TaxID=2303576 RepID=UPI000E56E419|nr:aminotransferase class V-fold PLP-dependent enzyme [Sphingomonas mesophila]
MTPADLDAADPLAHCGTRFWLPAGKIYLDGNSLGALPAATPARLRLVAEEQWGADLIGSWNAHGWIDWPKRVAAKLAPIVGAEPDELIIADSTSVCLFKALGAALALEPERRTIVARTAEFPTDLYVAEGLARLLPGVGLRSVDGPLHEQKLDGTVAAVLASHVDYRSGERVDLVRLNEAAHAAGALSVIDLSHSAGAIAVVLNGSGCDLAVGCGYKFLNGGPGAPAFLYVARHLQERLRSPIQGWMGHARPFDFAADYAPAPGIDRFLSGTPSILALAALECGLDTFDGVAIEDVEAKGRRLAEVFIAEVTARTGIDLGWQADRGRRGSHVVVPHPQGYAVMQALIARGVIGDFRPPDLMRFGFAPLYNSFADVVAAAEALGEILASGEWNQPRFLTRQKVT